MNNISFIYTKCYHETLAFIWYTHRDNYGKLYEGHSKNNETTDGLLMLVVILPECDFIWAIVALIRDI